jgi:hypothetical protein
MPATRTFSFWQCGMGIVVRSYIPCRRQNLDDADVLDAVVFAMAGADFMCGQALQPSDQTLARNEGWIWARLPPS